MSQALETLKAELHKRIRHTRRYAARAAHWKDEESRAEWNALTQRYTAELGALAALSPPADIDVLDSLKALGVEVQS